MSDSDEYDSEEDRILERLQNAQRARQIAKEASRQLDALHTYRQQKAATAAAAAAASRPTTWTEHSSNNPSGAETEPMYGGQHTKDTQDLALLLEHEALWTVLDASPCTKPNAFLTYHDIPWPPFDDFKQYITLMAEIVQQNGEKSRIQDRNALRKAYAKACLRWHPDKFQHRLGKGIEVEDLPSIMEKVQEIAQGINRAWSELKHHSFVMMQH